jgi:hypothetical protein
MENRLAMYTATESDHVERARERERERMLVNKY